MNIYQLKYFIRIIDHDFNITEASKSLYISQPALSKSLSQLESDSGFDFFIRNKGRLIGLTDSGKLIYQQAKVIIKEHDKLLKQIEDEKIKNKWTLKMGIPPLVIIALFLDFFGELNIKKPEISINIVEKGAHLLKDMLRSGELDHAVLLSPTDLDPNEFEEYILYEGRFSAFVSDKNELTKKEILEWDDFANSELSMCNDTYSTYHYVTNKLKNENIQIKSLKTFQSWDYAFHLVRNSNLVTILPHIMKYYLPMNGIKHMEIYNSIPWRIVLAYRKKTNYTDLERFMYKFTKYYFKDFYYDR